jgi:hypothetical protein
MRPQFMKESADILKEEYKKFRREAANKDN